MVDFAPDDLGADVAIDSETRSPLLLSNLRSIPWLQVSRTLKEFFSSVENTSIFNSAEDTGIPVFLVPSILEAYSGSENGLSAKGLLKSATDTAIVQTLMCIITCQPPYTYCPTVSSSWREKGLCACWKFCGTAFLIVFL